MFYRTALGDVSPALPIDLLIPAASPKGGSRRAPQACRLIAPRTRILLRDFPGSAEFRIKDGCIALYQSLSDGRRQILDILGPGSLLGLSIGNFAECSAETLTFTQIEPIKGPLSDVTTGSALRQMLRRSQALATLLGRKTAQEKVASALLDLSRQFARPAKTPGLGKTTFRLYLTRADLADWLGLTLETVSRCLSSFKRQGLIAFKHPEIITVTDEAALSLLASGQPASAQRTPAPGKTSSQTS